MTGPRGEATPIHYRHVFATGAVQAFRTVVIHQAVLAAGQYAQALAAMAALHATSRSTVHLVMADPEECVFCHREDQPA